MDKIELFKQCFRGISIDELHNRIHKYKSLEEDKDASEDVLLEHLRKIVQVQLNSELVSFFLNQDVQTNPYDLFYFYRIRKFAAEDYKKLKTREFPSIQKEQDVWNRPPSADAKDFGRLNRPNESVLYVSNSISNAIYETGCKSGESFFVIVYKSKKSMRLSQIQDIQEIAELTTEENSKRRIIHNFLLTEFSKVVPSDKNYQYITSILIYEHFFFNSHIDGFGYPPLKSHFKIGYNMCFTEKKAHENLSFIGLSGYEMLPPNIENDFMVRPLFDGFLNENKTFSFYDYNSEIAKNRFGDYIHDRSMGLP